MTMRGSPSKAAGSGGAAGAHRRSAASVTPEGASTSSGCRSGSAPPAHSISVGSSRPSSDQRCAAACSSPGIAMRHDSAPRVIATIGPGS